MTSIYNFATFKIVPKEIMSEITEWISQDKQLEQSEKTRRILSAELNNYSQTQDYSFLSDLNSILIGFFIFIIALLTFIILKLILKQLSDENKEKLEEITIKLA